MPSRPSSPSSLRTMVKYIRSLFTPGHSPDRNSTTTSTIRNSLRSLRHSRFGDTTSKAQELRLTWLLTTRTWSTSQRPNSLPDQVRWSKYLSQFNLIIRFCPRQLGAQPDSLTRRWDIYPKEGGSDYASVNPLNLGPIFTNEQLAFSLCATYFNAPILQAVLVMDIPKLHSNIKSALISDPAISSHLDSPPEP
jgi:hypothetical protein